MWKLFLGFFFFMSLAHGAEPLHVFVSVPPQKTIVERLGGRHVVVETMIKPGVNPHAYEPSPVQIAGLASADLYVRVGIPFETAWSERIQSVNPGMRILDSSRGIDLRTMEAHEHEHEHEHEHHDAEESNLAERDPHLWTSPPLVKRMAETIRETLAELDPAHADDYADNLRALNADLDALDRDIRSELSRLTHRRFMVFHPAWGYFAETYGLTQIPIEKAGKEPGPRSLAALIDQARREQVRVIFVQPQFSMKSAEQVARAIGGRVEAIDPLSPAYFENLRQVARAIADSEQ